MCETWGLCTLHTLFQIILMTTQQRGTKIFPNLQMRKLKSGEGSALPKFVRTRLGLETQASERLQGLSKLFISFPFQLLERSFCKNQDRLDPIVNSSLSTSNPVFHESGNYAPVKAERLTLYLGSVERGMRPQIALSYLNTFSLFQGSAWHFLKRIPND